MHFLSKTLFQKSETELNLKPLQETKEYFFENAALIDFISNNTALKQLQTGIN